MLASGLSVTARMNNRNLWCSSSVNDRRRIPRSLCEWPGVAYQGHQKLSWFLRHRQMRRVLEPHELLRWRFHFGEPVGCEPSIDVEIVTSTEDDEGPAQLPSPREIQAARPPTQLNFGAIVATPTTTYP